MNKTKAGNFQKGKSGEDEARRYLEAMGYVIVEANYCNDLGEIDLIMVDGKTLVFVEVKMKTDDRLGKPEEMISRGKLARIRRIAEIYLLLNPKVRRRYTSYRIDAVCILGKEIKHYINVGL